MFRDILILFLIMASFGVSGCNRDYDEKLKIVYRNTSGNLVIINEDGSDEKQITTHNQATYPCFSADGEKIAYIYNGTPDRIEIIDIEGNLLNTFTLSGSNFVSTAWSPDGEHIAVYETNIVYIYSEDGSLINSKQDGVLYVGAFTFLSNDEIVIGKNSSIDDIWNFKTGAVTPLNTTYSGAKTYSALSADRNYYIFFINGSNLTYMTDINNSSTVLLPAATSTYYPSWFADGKRYLYSKQADSMRLYIYDLTTSTEKKLNDNPSWNPTIQCMPR